MYIARPLPPSRPIPPSPSRPPSCLPACLPARTMLSLPALLSLSLAAVFAALPAVAVPATDTEQFPPDFRYDKHETDYRKLPRRSQLPRVPGNLEGSAWLWGEDDGVGLSSVFFPSFERMEGGGLMVVRADVYM